MAALIPLEARDAINHVLMKRKNWAAREAGVMVVFCVVFVVATGLLALDEKAESGWWLDRARK
ncbi:hypothetical protein BGZ57DRAFT_928468 [Hyaloscypha finlandica]|nr:hypothetical protein BGZ57DRAFT_928468 [Hyaloscypha finlandica]